MNLQICTLGRAIKDCRLGLWESPSHFPFQCLQTEEELKCDLLSNFSSVEMRKTHQCQLLQSPFLPGFTLQSCLVSSIRVQSQLDSFVPYFSPCCPFPISPAWHFLRAPAGDAHKKLDHLSAAISLQPTRERQTKGKSQDTKNPVVTSSHTRQSLHLSCNLYYSFFPVKRENKGK